MWAVIALWSAGLSAQTNDAWPAADRPIADYLSTAIAASTVVVDASHALYLGHQSGHTWTAMWCESLKLGGANGAALVLKHFFPEERPNGVDAQSFPSEHTANALAATGWSWQASIPVAASVGYLRTAANWHWWRDVGAGTLLGLGSRYATRRIPACHALI